MTIKRVVWNENSVYTEDEKGNLELIAVCPSEAKAIRVVNALRVSFSVTSRSHIVPGRHLQKVHAYSVAMAPLAEEESFEELEEEEGPSNLQRFENKTMAAEARKGQRPWR